MGRVRDPGLISIVIPTFRRAPFMARTLRYYAAAGFDGKLLVGDSSEEGEAYAVRREVARLSPRLDVEYLDCRGQDDRLTLHRLAMRVETPYVAYSGDDDYLFPTTLRACAEFLDANPGYVSVHGEGWDFALEPDGPQGQLRLLGPYAQPVLEQARARDRMHGHFLRYGVTLFGVHRAVTWRKMWSHSSTVADRTFAAELIPCCMTPLLGKIGAVSGASVLRQCHPQRYGLPGATQWVQGRDWQAGFDAFCRILGETLAESEGIATADAIAHVRESLRATYLKQLLDEAEARAADAATRDSIRSALSRVPGALQVARELKAALDTHRKGSADRGELPGSEAYSRSVIGRWRDPAHALHGDWEAVERSLKDGTSQ